MTSRRSFAPPEEPEGSFGRHLAQASPLCRSPAFPYERAVEAGAVISDSQRESNCQRAAQWPVARATPGRRPGAQPDVDVVVPGAPGPRPT